MLTYIEINNVCKNKEKYKRKKKWEVSHTEMVLSNCEAKSIWADFFSYLIKTAWLPWPQKELFTLPEWEFFLCFERNHFFLIAFRVLILLYIHLDQNKWTSCGPFSSAASSSSVDRGFRTQEII